MRGTEKHWTTLAQFTRRPAIVYVCHSTAIVCLLCGKPEYMFEHDAGSFLELLFFSCEGSRLNPTFMLFTYYVYILTEILLKHMADKADSQCQYQSEKPQKGESSYAPLLKCISMLHMEPHRFLPETSSQLSGFGSKK